MLQSIQLSSGPAGVSVQAQATVVDPVPLTFNFTSPSMPFIVSLPRPQDDNDNDDKTDDNDAIPVASVHTAPFSLTHPNITLSISGTLLPVPHTHAAPLFSTFLAAYLHGRPNPIAISTPLFPDLGPVRAVFPGPDPKPNVLRGVTIRDLRIKPPAGLVAARPFLASGTIVVRVVLPRGIDVDVNVTRVLPDVLVLDGDPPAMDDNDEDEEAPPPPRAFGRIQPADWLPSVTVRDEEEPDAERGSAYVVSAMFCDVPLQVLPGRDRVFRGFMSKVCRRPHSDVVIF